MTRKQKLIAIMEIFSKEMPNPETELNYKTPYQLAVAVILSAQCTDARVNKITPALFERFPDATAMAKASENEIFDSIKSCSYPNNKSKHLKGMAEKLISDYSGKLPDDVEEMQKLPGIGRKTANVLASVLFGKDVFPVDTHVGRLSVRIGLSPNAKTPLAIEKAIVKLAPKGSLHNLHHWLILHGRYTCKAINPKCKECKISSYCDYFSAKAKK